MRCALAIATATVATASLIGAASPATTPSVLPFIEDDYPKALARAKAESLPLFVDAWAPW
jgi:hypothetical protein